MKVAELGPSCHPRKLLDLRISPCTIHCPHDVCYCQLAVLLLERAFPRSSYYYYGLTLTLSHCCYFSAAVCIQSVVYCFIKSSHTTGQSVYWQFHEFLTCFVISALPVCSITYHSNTMPWVEVSAHITDGHRWKETLATVLQSKNWTAGTQVLFPVIFRGRRGKIWWRLGVQEGTEHKQDPCYEGKDLQHTLLLSFHSNFLGMVSQASIAIFLFMFPMFSACLLLYWQSMHATMCVCRTQDPRISLVVQRYNEELL